MRYYVISYEDGQILEVYQEMSNEIIQWCADEFKCAVFAIRGEHSDYAASPQWVDKEKLEDKDK